MVARFIYHTIIKFVYRTILRISPEFYIKFRYYRLFKQKINLKNPQKFSEKIQWLKLNDRDKRIIEYADKFLVREHIREVIGEEYLIPMPFSWDTPEEVDFSVLPEKFVLKPNNSSGRVIICKDKSAFDQKAALKKMKKWQKENLTRITGEWVYERIPFKIVCEEYLADDIMDYKMYFASGEFICTQVIAGRADNDKQFGYFDEKWNLMNIKRSGMPKLREPLPKPEKYEEMLKIASELARDFTFIRVDLYYIEGKIYFGELSFYPNNGFVKYETDEMDKIFGEKIVLPM